mgnify:FL=1
MVRIRFLLSIVDAINFDADVGLQFCFRGLGQFKYKEWRFDYYAYGYVFL